MKKLIKLCDALCMVYALFFLIFVGVNQPAAATIYDINRGTRPAALGPTTNDIVTTLSRNEIQATSGYYYEDYY